MPLNTTGQSTVSAMTEEKIGQKADDIEEVLFANKFASLNLSSHGDGNGEQEEASDEEEALSTASAPSKSQPKKRTAAGKKGKRKKNKKTRKHATIEEDALAKVPLESYRIIEDHDGLMNDYLMAVYAIFGEWIHLRAHIQGLWRKVAYGGLNSAVAGTISNMAITTVKQTETAIFVDFPGHDSFETIMQTITRGDPEKMKSNFGIGLHKFAPNSDKTEEVHKTHLDVMEQFSIHAYRDLLDFLADFQQTRSGKPTKRMLAQIRDWNPYLDLQRTTKEQRIQWRRAYTINWLYDLVNVFSSIVVQRNNMRGENRAYERVDWSVAGQCNQDRRLFGLNEFAGVITSLAIQKPGANMRERIFPHHVFQLQCIVDSLTVSRGWSLSGLRGHVLKIPAPGFRPRRDVDLFLDRDNQKIGSGYLEGIELLTPLMEEDAMIHGDPNRHRDHAELLKTLLVDFRDWLGESKYMHGLTTIPPSRFSNSSSNGLWEFSPFLCGVGLMESLELAYQISMLIWDRMSEPILLVHIHNMLVQKGYIAQPIELYAALADIFKSAYFADGKIPTTNFGQALLAHISENGSRRAMFQRRALRRTAARSGTDIHKILDLNVNRFFTTESNLLLYRRANWSPDRIPEAQISPTSALGVLRLGQTGKVVDRTTGQSRLEDTDLAQRARAMGMNEALLLNISSILRSLQNGHGADKISQSLLASLTPEGYTSEARATHDSEATNTIKHASKPSHRMDNLDVPNLELLALTEFDIAKDISGATPLSGINWIWVTVRFMMLFMQIEEKLRQVRNLLWIRAYETGREWSRQKRVGIAYLALSEGDEECLTIMADEFQNQRAGLLDHIYWGDIDVDMKTNLQGDDDKEPDCVV
ncbi:MAG: hypothetical protein Q9165_005222, partial [Trypethelium subeluteriae]